MKTLLKISTLLLFAISTTGLKAQTKQEIAKMERQLKQLTAADKLVQQHLKTFDTLDYTVFSEQQWARFHESHGKDIKVVWPDSHVTTGLAKHIEDMKALFVYAPDTRIKYILPACNPSYCLKILINTSA